MTSNLETCLNRFRGRTIAVVGDVMLDDYVWGKAARISPEAPVMVLDAQRESQVPGGAANVAHNVTALGAEALLAGVIGDDLSGDILADRLADIGIEAKHLIRAPGRTTTRKTRIIAHHQQVLRLDREERAEPEPEVAERLLETALGAVERSDAVVISDYRKGCLNETRVRVLVSAARDMRKPCLANPKPASMAWYAGASLVSMNRVEAEGFSGLEEAGRDELVAGVAERLRECDVRNGLVTLGEEGMVLCGDTNAHIPALRVEVYDTAGAGDTVIATIALGMAGELPLNTAARIANLAAGCVVRHVGVAVPAPDEVLALARAHQYPV